MASFLQSFSSPKPHTCSLSNPHLSTNRPALRLALSSPRSQCATHNWALSCRSPSRAAMRSLPSNLPPHHQLHPRLSPRLYWATNRGCTTLALSQESSGTTSTFFFCYHTISFISNVITCRSTHFQTYCVPRSIQYPQFDQTPLAMPVGCSFDENPHQVYTMGGNGEHLLTSTEGLSHPYNEELLVRPQFVSY